MTPSRPDPSPPAWRFRPHHLLCWQTYRGKGYSEPFVATFDALKAAYAQDAAVTIVLGIRADAICEPCPHRQGESCHFAASVDQRDQALLDATGYRHDQVLPLPEALAFVEPHFLALQETVCKGCEWQPFCRDAYLDVHPLRA